MAKQGWLTIRNLPEIDPGSDGYHRQLSDFFESYSICPKCKGRGFRQKVQGKLKAETTVKYAGIEVLEDLQKIDGVSLTNLIRDVLERLSFGRKSCRLCSGTSIVSIKRASVFIQKRRHG